ncbi:MmpS family transport accessory protein [Mycobacterium marinum]|uniref:MmpS family transport accessory protein n=1 Tax=Mycobacterium marinum TaxID=1781 RepID=UPI0015956112|nr:MmpS family transport accessory protein [Mycobacterium marinum]MDC8985590.1 MmpS family transport accessory protein [Mycobacterium marinum]MDC8997464.1 MmpS family transport accessory protein [Mycobacterium marinum]MDC9002879.1 MmpS family transport accessory protein [Mycobacterium marinum]MDC9013617.1 MmpS family transport accessory protein [Mycobacterium marinum]MDC9018978.1 MmpS family transport accessory protein [Mycobacterium marinum]
MRYLVREPYADIKYPDPEAMPRDLNKMELPWAATVTATAGSLAPILVERWFEDTLSY